MEIQIAAAKINQFGRPESGDTLEVVERPNGGLSVVLADGQRGGKPISQMVVRKVIGLLAEGVRDGAAARAASDALFTEKQGQASCTLNIASLDLMTNTIVLTRNNPTSLAICRRGIVDYISSDCEPLGLRRDTRPLITETILEPNLTILLYTDGLTAAGTRRGQPMEVATLIQSMLDEQDPSPQSIADELLAHAVSLDASRPADDISVVVIKVAQHTGDSVRRMNIRLPIN